MKKMMLVLSVLCFGSTTLPVDSINPQIARVISNHMKPVALIKATTVGVALLYTAYNRFSYVNEQRRQGVSVWEVMPNCVFIAATLFPILELHKLL